MEEACGVLVELEEVVSGADAGGVGFRRRGEAEAAGEQLDGLLEGDLLDHLDEAEEVAAGLTAEAMPQAFLGVEGERGGVLLVEGAEAEEAAPGLAEANVGGDDIDDVGSAANLLEVPATPGHGPSPPGHMLRRCFGGLLPKQLQRRCGERVAGPASPAGTPVRRERTQALLERFRWGRPVPCVAVRAQGAIHYLGIIKRERGHAER